MSSTLGFDAVIYLAGLRHARPLLQRPQGDHADAWPSYPQRGAAWLRAVLSFVTMVTIIASADVFSERITFGEARRRPEDEEATPP